MTIVKAFVVASHTSPLGVISMLRPSNTSSLRSEDEGTAERLELRMANWLAIRAEGRIGIRAAVFLVSWLTALGLVFVLVR